MKKLTLLLALLLAVLQINAAPALRGAFTVRQADGTLLTIEQFGDEHHHWTATTDGTMVVNTGHGYFVAQIDEQGQLQATDVLAHEADQRSDEEQRLVERQAQRRTLFHQQGEAARRRALSIGSNSYYKYFPHTGSPRVLCILAEFQDVKFTVNEPQQAFYQMMNGNEQKDMGNHNQNNVASVRQFFEVSSHGVFTPEFDVVGPVTLPKKMADYGGKKDDGSDDQFNLFCKDAIAKVKEDGLVSDWGRYDNDGDKKCELVCIIYAGYGQNQGGDNNTIWAKASMQNIKADDNHTLSFFNCSCELFHNDPRYVGYINGTGVFLHEMSHCMGLPDLYVTVSSGYANNQGMETWDLMDYGCYNRNGYAPSLYTAWEQEAMGWIDIEPVTEARQLTSLVPLEEGGKAYKIVNPDNDKEFIVMENIQQRGLNQYAYGHGLLVYHVAYPNTTVNMGDRINNTVGRPGVAVVPAGGTLISSYLRGTGKSYTNAQWKESLASSTFPGTLGAYTLSAELGLPNYCFYVGYSSTKAVDFTLTGITEDALGGITFNIETTAILTPKINADSLPTKIFTLDGRLLSAPQRGLNIINGRKVLKK